MKHIERWRRHPLLGPVIIVLLVLLVVLTAFHEGHESLGAEMGVLCVGIAVILLAIISAAVISSVTICVDGVVPPRGPPISWSTDGSVGHGSVCVSPLRL